MTVLTKPSLTIKKAALITGVNCDEEMIDYHPSGPLIKKKRTSPALVCLTMLALMVVVMGLAAALALYQQHVQNTTRRYQGFCTIPIPKDVQQLQEPEFQMMQLHWAPDTDLQVVSTLEEDSSDEVINALREKMDIGDTVEKISVYDNGRQIHFIHDFETNTSGIVDAARCFTMSLSPELVWEPRALAGGLARDKHFDVSRVRSRLRAALPALDLSAALHCANMLLDLCRDKPLYSLHDEQPLIRKRSADAPPHDYIQFAGSHVQEIEITNMAELLQHEQNHRLQQ